MAKEALRARKSEGTVKPWSIVNVRRTSLPLFPSDLGKDVPNYLRASGGSCHDYCKYGRKVTTEVKQNRPCIKRNVVASGFKAPDKPQSMQDDPFKIQKPQNLPDDKTPEASPKQSASRAKGTKVSKDLPKSVEPKLLKEKSITRTSVATSGYEKLKRQKEIVPESGNLRDAQTNIKCNESEKLTRSAKGPSTNADVKQKAKAKPSPSPTPLKVAARVTPLSSSSPRSVKPLTKAKPHSSPTQSKPLSWRANSSSSPGSLKLKSATVRTSTPSIPPQSVSSKKTINIRSQIVKKGKSSKVQATEAVATRGGSISPNFNVAPISEKKDLQLEKQDEAEFAEKMELLEKNEENSIHEFAETKDLFEKNEEDSSHEFAETKELFEKNEEELNHEFAETKELFEKNEGDSSHETELQNHEATEPYDDEVPEKTLYVIEVETGNSIQPAPNAEDEISDMQTLASLSPPQSPSSPICVTVSNMTTQSEESLNELTNTDTPLPCAESADQETPDMKPLPYADQETPDMQPLPSLSPAISPKSQSSAVALNELSHYEASLDGSMYTESEDGYSSYEDDHIIERENENLKGADSTKINKSAKVTSQDSGKDPVKLRFRRGRVIEIRHENHGPRRLKFRRVVRVPDDKAAKDFVRKSSFKMTEATQVNASTDNISGTVVLRHQDMQDKKDAQGLFNNVIEETASKLVGKRKSMVKALVGAFETVISLQDGKPATTQHDL